MNDLFIDVRIPYEPGRRLGFACNRIMQTVDDWVLFLDHDVFLLHENWYNMALTAIRTVGHQAGIITCLTNRIGCPLQRHTVDDVDDIGYHSTIAHNLAASCDGILQDVTGEGRGLSGFFMLTHRKAWEAAGGFSEKFLGMDTYYTGKVREAGYRLYVMRNLYVYHRYWRVRPNE